ncbi:helix-turn-helix domain-containing protein [Nocardioides guangzhouensis]|uniref:Helix-turn-helix domain-containing protein n=1 Tax=Nocardioides guangzhouensis TaxID=2497878 RepID=A0A4Q4ZIF8_9ACTN|nr:helix-turn-helix transcriptional regulator [Nocardioides guangzhouensis]RYP88003.1 helix-turn-helix domain-containing protein [Nocardioides guangzhouensis]
MDARQIDVLNRCDPAELGRRLRAVRLSRGMTQSDVAGSGMSIAYVSRMESGQRRPTVKVLDEIAHRLEVSVEELLGQPAPREVDEIRLTLDYAELSLESGEPLEAATRVGEALGRLESAPVDGLDVRARFLNARAHEALGHTDDAIEELESLVAGGAVSGLMRVKAGIALSRVYRESGDLGRAIDTGEHVLAELTESGLDSSDEAVQLAVTIAAAYFERGDSGHAVRICRAAIAKAEELGSPTARASAYWNASAMQARRGDIGNAAPLAERALALLSEGQDSRNLARLRTELGRLQLALDPPAVEQARENLEKAAEELAWSSAAPVDRAWTQLGLARAGFLAGDLVGGRELANEVHAISDGHAPLAEAEARALEGQTYAAEGDMAQAARAYQQAVLVLSAIGADRGAAQLWFDLADLLDQVGLADEARAAYRRAAASTGLRARTRTPTRSLV